MASKSQRYVIEASANIVGKAESVVSRSRSVCAMSPASGLRITLLL